MAGESEIHRRLKEQTFLVTTPGLLSPGEAPLGWGLLETDGTAAICQKLAPTRFSRVEMLEWLKRIAKAPRHFNQSPRQAKPN